MEQSQDDPFIEEEGMSSKGYYQDEGEEGTAILKIPHTYYLISILPAFTFKFKLLTIFFRRKI